MKQIKDIDYRMSFAEIAKELEIKRWQVEYAYKQAIAKFREKLL